MTKRGWIGLVFLGVLAIVLPVWGQSIVGPDQMNQCDQATFTVTITNQSATQDACFLTITHTLPNGGFLYVPGSTTLILDETLETFTDDPVNNVWDIDALRGSAYALPPGETITLSYEMETTCAAVSGTDIITVDFEDCDDPGVPLQNVSSTSIELLPGAIIVSKTPSVQDASVGDLVTWTITVENTGLGTISNVEIVDLLGSGLAFDSASDGGLNAGQITTWDETTTPGLTSIAVGGTVSVQLTAEVIACSGLTNDVDASFGCGPSDICFDTAIDEGTATASLNLIVENPDLVMSAPDIVIPYCAGEETIVIPITNNGAGTARNVELCVDIPTMTVANVQGGASYSSGCFTIPDIAPSGTFNLTFDLLFSGDWCSGGPSGTDTFELTYTNDCNIPFVAFPQFSTLSSEAGPSLAVSKTGPDSLRLGEIGTYNVQVSYVGSTTCGGSSPGPVTIVDTYPEGFTVIDPAGGAVNSGARTITWGYDPNTDPPFDESIQLQAPTDCSYCAQPGGASNSNTLTATGTDCCGCPISGEGSVETELLCEGYGDDVTYFSSSIALNRTTTVRCSSDYAITVTHTYSFIDDPALDDFLLNEFEYFLNGNGDLQYDSGSLTVTGASVDSIADTTPSGQLIVRLADATSVRGKTVVYEYTLIAQDLDAASCQVTSYPIQAGVELDPGATSIGVCGTMYPDPPFPTITAQPPSMNVSIDGIPVIQEYCATYDVTITLTRTSALAKPYDARLVLSNNGGSVLDMSQATCGGNYSPTDGTSCTTPIEAGSTYEWRYADLFDNENDTATITFPVTVPCGGPLADLSVVATYDDLCHDDAVYDASCSTSSDDEASLSLSADVYISKTPEILYATTRQVAWSVTIQNTGNGTAYNTWVDDVLGSGLVYDSANSSIDNPTGATEYPNLDHEGTVINGVSWIIDELAPGDVRTITVAAELVACDGLTNDVSTAWGCDGVSCQTPRTDSSSVVIPPGHLVATSYSPTPVPMCSDNMAIVTMKNAGVSTLYNLVGNVTLPTGLIYLGNPEVQVNGGGWSPTGEPSVAGQVLTWTQTETPTLDEADPNEVIEIRFDYTVGCGFETDDLEFQASYEDPCAAPQQSNIGRFTIGLTPAEVLVDFRQVSPAPGEALDCGGQATWEIDVTNDGSVIIPVVQVIATLDDGLTFVSSSGDPTYGPADGGSNTGQTVVWELANLPIDAVATLSMTAASTGGGLDCEALDVFVDASWGCGAVDGASDTFDADCTTTSPASATISGTREPPLDLSANLSPGSIEACDDSTTLTLAIQNTGTTATTSYIDMVIDLPAELSYIPGSTEIDCGGGFVAANDPNTSGQTLTWYDIAAEDGVNDACASIPPGGTAQLRFDVVVSCYFTTQDIPIDVHFYDCCGLTQYTSSTSVSLTSLLPSLTVDKSPVNSTLDCYNAADTATWTITVENTGAGTADWVRITDTLGSVLVLDGSDSPTAGPGISMGANVVGWEIGPLAPSESFTATVTAHMIQPSDNCSLTPRRNTATVLWGCGAFDGDPNTSGEATCDIGSTVQDQANVRIPNLSIASSDITPNFTCTGDGVAPSSGTIDVVVRNDGDGDITSDFEVTITETTTGYSVSDRFTNLGGTLPLSDGTTQTLTFSNINMGCANCDYAFVVALDFLDEICECREDDNLATLNETITLPDLVVDSAALSVTCAGDGEIRIQGPVTLRNDGCGVPLTDDLTVRFRIYDGANCTGNEIDTFTVDFTGLSLAAGGGIDQDTIDITRTLAACNLPDCQLSIRIEADDGNSICECDGTNNALCAGTFAIATPDMTITDIDFSQVTCVADTLSGVVRVTVENTGCGDSGPFDLRLETDGCLSFADETVANLSAGASTTVDFTIAGTWEDCADCSCTFTATVDPDGNVCECDGANNARSEPYTSVLPDLTISGAVASLGCASDGNATIDADVTIANAGCADVSGSFDIRVTVYDGANCTGNVVDTWIETITGETIVSGGSRVISLSQRILAQSLCAGDCGYSAHFEVDAGNDICECDGTNNEFCLSSIPSETPDIVVTAVVPSIDCQAGTATVTATVGNIGCGDATGVVFRLTSSGCAPTTDSAPIDLAAGASQDIVFSYTPNCSDWNCSFTVTADPTSTLCECDGDNALTLDPYPGIGSIGDRVWFDTDAGGDQDPGELGIANVTVILEADLDGDDLIDYTTETTTDANGEYLFDDLPAGDYTITVDDTTLPEGMGQTYDYDGLGTPHASDYTLGENEHNREQDFGYRGLGSIGDYVWIDANADGVQDPSEEGIAGVTVTLEGDLNGDGINETLTTTTDADGLYLFDILPAGPYTITVDETTLPDGLSQTYDDDGLGSPHTSDYTLGAGEHNREQDFGYASPALSVDKVIADILRNGVSIGNITGPVEPGDVIVYQFAIENVGPVPAYHVGFDDTLPAGVVIETDAPGNAGSYVVTDPAASGSLALSDGATIFDVPLGLTVNPGETLTATFTARVTSNVSQGDDLTNTAHAYGEAEDGTPIPPENALLGDTSDSDVEDPDADDTGIVTVTVLQPALSVDKTITDIMREGSSLGIAGPVQPGDIVLYRFVITNIGAGTAYDVDFTDTLPPGMETRAGGTFSITSPATSGSLGLIAGASSFTTAMDAEIAGGEALSADFGALVTSGIVQGTDLVNIAEASGIDGAGTEIPDENAALGDTADGDVEDPDPDDTGIAVVGTEEPALSVDKIITDILRGGSSIGTTGPVEPGDIVFYRYTITNVGLGTAYNVDFTDTLPTGMVTETNAPGHAGSYTVTDPTASGSLGLADGVGIFTTSLAATISGGEALTADYTVVVTSDIEQGTDLINIAATTGEDGAGNPIPGENADLGDTSDGDSEDPDADDTGITILATQEPALTIDKQITDVIRGGSSIGVVEPVLYDDVIEYTVTIRNVGLGTAYNVNFDDTLPSGLETEAQAPGTSGAYTVSAPVASGGLNVPDAVAVFSTSINATLAGGATLTAVYTVRVTPTALPAVDLVNVAATWGQDGFGTPIPEENAATGDTSDDDEEDPDADDTGIASVRVGAPALVTRKSVLTITRAGTVLNDTGVEPGDIVTYEVGVANVGNGPAQSVNLNDTLPTGFVYEGNTDATWPQGSSSADPSGIPGPTLDWPLNADLEPGDELVLRYDAQVTPEIVQGERYINVIRATGEDGAGQPIPPDHRSIIPEDDDPDDASEASLLGAVPALVTEKTILNIVRDGRSLGSQSTVREQDRILYQLRITNVGGGTAYAVDVTDQLPEPFAFIDDSTQGRWPYRVGVYTRNPSGAPGPTLLWDTDATLETSDTLLLTFEARVDGPVDPGATYTNILRAEGEDGAGTPIPPNHASDVPQDIDPDDRDDVSLTGVTEGPALITTKRVTDLIRAGKPVADGRIEEGDIIEYELTVQNVGTTTAYAVTITDRLPTEFGYIDDTSSATWPLGSSFDDPSGFGELRWGLDATLRPGDRLVLQYMVFVLGPIYDGSAYTNVMQATGEGPDGTPIPPDQRTAVPSDIDPDDASQTTLVGRSAYIQGEGGLVAVPILRKTAEILTGNVCEAWSASVDRLWFQTDIALYAASEFEALLDAPSGASVAPDTLLPTWWRTVRDETQTYALSNLLQVNALSSIGVSLAHGPLVREHAAASGDSPIEALTARLDQLAARAGLDDASLHLPLPQDWIFLETAGGEPIYNTWLDTDLGPSGQWTLLDPAIHPSSLGMGLVKQTMEAKRLLSSAQALDRFVGWVIVDAMDNKIASLDSDLMLRDSTAAYVPHHTEWDDETGFFTTVDRASVLFDQLSLLWGVARVIEFAQSNDLAWPAGEADRRQRTLTTARELLRDILAALDAYHLSDRGTWLDRGGPGINDANPATTVDLGLLLIALDAARSVVQDADRATIESFVRTSIDDLVRRQGASGWLSTSAESEEGAPWALTSQLAGIRGLLLGAQLLSEPSLIDRAQTAFDALDRELWMDGIGSGLYADRGTEEWKTTCYTPLEIGLAAGALRELAHVSEADRTAHLLSRLSGFIRSVVDEAALQLTHAVPGRDDFVAFGEGRIAPIRSDDELGPLAPVLQQRLCLSDHAPDATCADWAVEDHDPRYRTDISMFAAYVIQNRQPAIEDVADANLVAVTQHSGLGIAFDAIPGLQSALERFAAAAPHDAAQLAPIAIPYAGGDPRLSSGSLAWDPNGFDTRFVASAQGMTLLRESQELGQWLQVDSLEAHERLHASILLASILQKLVTLQQWQIEGPAGIDYIPHEMVRNESEALAWSVLDASSTLFDQTSLIYGLSEAVAVLSHPQAEALLAEQPFPSAAWPDIAQALLVDVLETLDGAHRDIRHGGLVDHTRPSGGVWVKDEAVSVIELGLLTAAIDRALVVFGSDSSIGRRLVDVLDREVTFLRTELLDPSGGFFETWPQSSHEPACDQQTLTGQLAGLRALLAGIEWTSIPEAEALHALRLIDARFWDADLQIYRRVNANLTWCVTPLDLGIAVESLSLARSLVETAERRTLDTRLIAHVDRLLDALPLQLSSIHSTRREFAIGERTFAPVFDARVCVRSTTLREGQAWAEPGDRIRYTVTAENATEMTFTALELLDRLPDGVRLLALDPAGEPQNGNVTWTFDELAPSETRTWQLLVQVDEAASDIDTFENCATLTYSDEGGTPQPPRDACATVERVPSDDGLSQLLDTLNADYVTDQAMHLSAALSDLGCAWGATWDYASDAKNLADTNLGLLLGESGLGVSLLALPQFDAMPSREDGVQNWIDAIAHDAGIDSPPAFENSIVLPYESGTPILRNDGTLSPESEVITPAALGWTLAREAQYVKSCHPIDTTIATFAVAWTQQLLAEQLAWIAEQIEAIDASAPYLVQEIRATETPDRTEYGISDPRSTVYGQASLLIGLLQVAQTEALDSRTRRLAEQIAEDTLDQLLRHWDGEQAAFIGPLESDAPPVRAAWSDQAIASRALAEAMEAFTRQRNALREVLRALSAEATRQGAERWGSEEAGRLLVLFVTAEATNDSATRASAIEGWDQLRQTTFPDGSRPIVLAPQAVRGWAHAPGQLALIFDLLAVVARVPGEDPEARRVAESLLLSEVLEDRVQLLPPDGFWTHHAQTSCAGIAPVFALHRGELPAWLRQLR